ncbi:hypothetical protein COO60DRAFT_1700795 [Scenedesmus sp. NREL 46B-D3]|nr:hypothetical protein COO60DRAFT_1700795 [Scenedesmus sp. NREL 46B-D3]
MRALLLECGSVGLQLLGSALRASDQTAATAALSLPCIMTLVRYKRRSTLPQGKQEQVSSHLGMHVLAVPAAAPLYSALLVTALVLCMHSKQYRCAAAVCISQHSLVRVFWLQDEKKRQIDEAHDLLQPLACSRKFIEQVYSKRFRLPSAPAPHGSFPQELHARITALQDIAHAHTQQQRAALSRRLWHSTELLNLRPETLRHKAAALSQQLQQQDGVTAGLVQRLITAQPSVLMFRPETLAQKLAGTGKRLGVLPPVVLGMWLRQRSLINNSMDTLDAKLLELAGMLHLQEQGLQKLVVAAPTLLASCMDKVRARFENLLDCLPSDTWTAEMLGRALVSYPAVLTYSAETVRHKWEVVGRYAAMHEPSSKQLRKQQQAAVVLNFFTRSAVHISMLEYIMQQPPQPLLEQQQRQQTSGWDAHSSDGSSSSSDSSSSDDEASLQLQLSSGASSAGRPALDLLVAGQAGPMPRLLCVLSPNKAKWAALQQQYPGFADWYKQQKEGQQKQQQQQQDDEDG